MDIPLNVDVHCSDGRCGRSSFIIINPMNDEITHVVVKEKAPSQVERMVPRRWIVASTSEVIVLNRSLNDFLKLEVFSKTDFIYTDLPHHATDPKLTLLWPYAVPAKRVVGAEVRAIPYGQLAVRRGARVQATDGSVGRVDEFLVEPETGNITHLVLKEGNIFGKKYITIPISAIDRIEERTVYLNLDKSMLTALSPIELKKASNAP